MFFWYRKSQASTGMSKHMSLFNRPFFFTFGVLGQGGVLTSALLLCWCGGNSEGML